MTELSIKEIVDITYKADLASRAMRQMRAEAMTHVANLLMNIEFAQDIDDTAALCKQVGEELVGLFEKYDMEKIKGEGAIVK